MSFLGKSFAISTTYPKIVTNGLVLNLDAGQQNSYPGSGTTWTDLSGNGNNGTLVNGPTYSSANYGSIAFDGSNDYVFLNFANPFAETVIVWAKSATTNWNQYGWLSSSRRPNGHIIHPDQGTKDVNFYTLSAGSSYTVVGIARPSDITVPHMYAYTTNGSNEHKVYLDALLVNTDTTSISRATGLSPQNYEIGKDDGTGRFGQGNIYAVQRYNRALTAAEISQNFNALRSRYGI